MQAYHFSSPRKISQSGFYTYSTLADLCCQKNPQHWFCLEQFSGRALRNSSLKNILLSMAIWKNNGFQRERKSCDDESLGAALSGR